MDYRKKKKRAITLFLMMVIGLLSTNTLTAQGGMFERGTVSDGFENKDIELLGRSEQTGIIDNQTFGQPVPFGSGVILLIAAGASYAALKRKEEKK